MHMQSCEFKDAINSWEDENTNAVMPEEDRPAGPAQITAGTTEQPGWEGGKGGGKEVLELLPCGQDDLRAV